jgi:putative metal binding uncharacterized protein
MFLDPAVEQRKFEHELHVLRRNAARLSSRGIWLVRAVFPEIDFICVPRLPLRVAFPLPPQLQPQGVPIGAAQAFDFQALSGRAFGVRLDLAGYDQRAPSVTFRDQGTWELLPFALLPLGVLSDDPSKPQQVVLDAHPTAKRPFLCLRGVREYHEHPQHDGDDWAIYRSSLNVYVILERLARVMLGTTRPQLLFAAAAPGQVALQLQWVPEIPA